MRKLSVCVHALAGQALASTPGNGLTLSFIVDAALRLGLELCPDAVKKLVQTLAGATGRTAHDAGRIAVIHGREVCAFATEDLVLGDCETRPGGLRRSC